MFPRLAVHHPHLDVGDVAKIVVLHEIVDRHDIRTESELKIHRGYESSGATRLENPARHGEVLAHRLLNQHARTNGKPLHDAHNLIAGNGDVEHRVVGSGSRCLVQAAEHPLDVELSRRFVRRLVPDVEDAGHLETEPPIRRQVRGSNNGAGADDHDRERP